MSEPARAIGRCGGICPCADGGECGGPVDPPPASVADTSRDRVAIPASDRNFVITEPSHFWSWPTIRCAPTTPKPNAYGKPGA